MTSIRPATVGDAQTIARIHVDSWRSAYDGVVPQRVLIGLSVEDRCEHWMKQICQGPARVLVAEKESALLGWIAFGPCRDEDFLEAAEVYALYVDPSSTRSGVGTRLWSEAMGAVAALGYAEVVVWVLADNRPARQFYEAMTGARLTDAQKEIVLGGKSLEEVRYRCGLGPRPRLAESP